MSAKKQRPPWRATQYTPLLNTLVLALARSDLTARAICAFLVVATETWGHTGERWKEYGRASAAVSVANLAQKMNVHESTARRSLLELEDKGWVTRVRVGRGRAATTWEPSLAEPVVMVDAETPSTGSATTSISDWLEQKRAEAKAEAIQRGMAGG